MANSTISWEAATAETVENLRRLIQANTTNPPGNESLGVEVVKSILEKDGFPSEDIKVVEKTPGRGNLIVRLRGDGSERPLLLSGHLDVVPVERERWTHDPFGGELIDGYVWGRGALDMKGFLAMYLEAFLLARRQGLPLKRDLILAAIADEEAGFDYGSAYLVQEQHGLIDAEFALTEGGGLPMYISGRPYYGIQVAEKGVCWLRMTVTGEPGHGSMPHKDNAVMHLAQSLDRLRRAGHLPVHITPTTRQMIQALAVQASFPVGWLVGLMQSQAVVELALKLVPDKYYGMLVAMVSNSVSPTVLQAGSKTNVIPSKAQAHLDCRFLPGQTPESAMREILDVMGSGVSLEPLSTTSGAEFSTDTPLYHLLEQVTRRMDPHGVVIPIMSSGATDACQYQKAGIQVYGFAPGITPPDYPLLKMGHGHDERLPISFVETGLPALLEVIREFA